MHKKRLVTVAVQLLIVMAAISTHVFCATIGADLELVYLGQYENNGFHNQYSLQLTNTEEIPIFALFINPEGRSLNNVTDTNGADNWITKESNGHNGVGWMFFLQAGEYLKDVPDSLGWVYNGSQLDYLAVVYNSTHDDENHSTADPLLQGESLNFIYTMGGADEGDESVLPLTYLVAGYDPGTREVLTAEGSLPIPEPGALTVILAALASLSRRRK